MNPNKNTVLEIFAVIIIIAVLTSAFFFRFYHIKVGVRNSTRQGDVAEIQKALLFYKNKHGKFPISKEGECITTSRPVTEELHSLSTIRKAPEDPIWPQTRPSELKNDNTPAEGTMNFCYWYVSFTGKTYYLSYYMTPQGEDKTSKKGVVTVSNKPGS